PPPIYRCPACRSLDVGTNEARSAYDLTYMECTACGNGALVDWIGRDDWVITVQDQEDARVAFGLQPGAPVAAVPPVSPVPAVPAVPAVSPAPVAPVSPAPVSPPSEPEPELGCVMCTGDDAEEAWEAMETHHVRSLVREVHFGVDVKRCFCDQLFAVVFTERIDFRDGDDDQTWLAVPITDEERARLEAVGTAEVSGTLVALVRQRRFLAKTRQVPAPWWCDGGFSIFPHD
ncbi:MAG: hypothetical protein Q8P41_08295, partial [Pseudomonadota bacterium]|nr:hypothetical protein [Pseudomonadota bacterium]